MVNMTLAIPDDLHKIMREHSEIKWSEVARRAIQAKAHKLNLMEKLLANSELTEEDALRIGKEIKKGMRK